MAESRGVGYTVYDAFEAVAKGADTQAGTGGNAGSYEEFLEWIRKQITDHHSGELAKAIGSEEAASTLRTLIAKYISSAEQNAIPAGMALQELIDTIYQDMAGLGVLTELLKDPDVEEININGFRPGGIEVIRSKGLEFLKQGFPSADAALNTIKKMVRMGGQTLDASNPVVDSDLGDGVTRISAYIPPVARKEDGVIASIRRQRLLPVTREDYITNGMVTAEMLDFLTCCVINGCSVSFAGGMGSGKTTDLTFLLNQYLRENSDPNNRVMVIGDTDEVRTITWDEKHNRPARVIYGLTSPSPVKKTMRDLVKEALRQNAHVIAPMECRDAAAYDVVDAGQTGQVIVTTFHGMSAKNAYMRLLSLCQMANTGLSENTLMEYIITALPIMVFKKMEKDGSRKFMEIFEATGHSGGAVTGQILFKYKKDLTDYDETGEVKKVHGHFEKINNISDNLRERLEDNGGREVKAFLDRIFS